MLSTKGRKIILFGFLGLWAFFYIFGFMVQNSFRPISDRTIPWPWTLRGIELRDLVIIPSAILVFILSVFHERKPPPKHPWED